MRAIVVAMTAAAIAMAMVVLTSRAGDWRRPDWHDARSARTGQAGTAALKQLLVESKTESAPSWVRICRFFRRSMGRAVVA